MLLKWNELQQLHWQRKWASEWTGFGQHFHQAKSESRRGAAVNAIPISKHTETKVCWRKFSAAECKNLIASQPSEPETPAGITSSPDCEKVNWDVIDDRQWEASLITIQILRAIFFYDSGFQQLMSNNYCLLERRLLPPTRYYRQETDC